MAQPSSHGSFPKSRRLNVGVLGLGRRWQSRYLPALQAMRDRFAIRAVADSVAFRTEEEARKLECDPNAGMIDLLENPAVEAVLLLDEAWYGLWPIEAACRVGKPVFCAAVSAVEAESLELCRTVRDRGLPVMMAMASRLAVPTQRAQELLQNELGAARLIIIDSVHSASVSEPSNPVMLDLVDWCLTLIGRRPATVQMIRATSGVLANMLVEFTDGAAAQIIGRQGTGRTFSRRLEITASQGTAEIQLPNRVRWRTQLGQHLEQLPAGGSRVRLLLEYFHQAVTEGIPMRPNLDDAWTAMQCLRAARASLSAEGRRTPVS
jgi:predicted dehydrogenase